MSVFPKTARQTKDSPLRAHAAVRRSTVPTILRLRRPKDARRPFGNGKKAPFPRRRDLLDPRYRRVLFAEADFSCARAYVQSDGDGRFETDKCLTSGSSGDAMRAPLATIGRRRRATILVMSGAVFPAECAVYHPVADTIIQWEIQAKIIRA